MFGIGKELPSSLNCMKCWFLEVVIHIQTQRDPMASSRADVREEERAQFHLLSYPDQGTSRSGFFENEMTLEDLPQHGKLGQL
jgi:hypothetical protein